MWKNLGRGRGRNGGSHGRSRGTGEAGRSTHGDRVYGQDTIGIAEPQVRAVLVNGRIEHQELGKGDR